MSTTYPRNIRHSIAYYAQVIGVMLEGIKNRRRQSAIADELNRAKVPSSTGAEWNAEMVKAVLKRLRQRSGPHYHALLQLCFDGAITPTQCKPLLQTL